MARATDVAGNVKLRSGYSVCEPLGRHGAARCGSTAAGLQDSSYVDPGARLVASSYAAERFDGRIIAEIADYAVVRDLVADLVAEGAAVAIKPEVRQTVLAVAKLLTEGKAEVTQAEIAKALELDKSSASRRIAATIDGGWLRNLEDRKGRPHRLVLGEPLPEEFELLPAPERLRGCRRGCLCSLCRRRQRLPLRILRCW